MSQRKEKWVRPQAELRWVSHGKFAESFPNTT